MSSWLGWCPLDCCSPLVSCSLGSCPLDCCHHGVGTAPGSGAHPAGASAVPALPAPASAAAGCLGSLGRWLAGPGPQQLQPYPWLGTWSRWATDAGGTALLATLAHEPARHGAGSRWSGGCCHGSPWWCYYCGRWLQGASPARFPLQQRRQRQRRWRAGVGAAIGAGHGLVCASLPGHPAGRRLAACGPGFGLAAPAPARRRHTHTRVRSEGVSLNTRATCTFVVLVGTQTAGPKTTQTSLSTPWRRWLSVCAAGGRRVSA